MGRNQQGRKMWVPAELKQTDYGKETEPRWQVREHRDVPNISASCFLQS